MRRRRITTWLVTLLTLFLSSFSTLDVERVREVFADGRCQEYYQVDVDGLTTREDLDDDQGPGAQPSRQPAFSHRLTQVVEAPGFSVSTASTPGVPLPAPVVPAAWLGPAPEFPALMLVPVLFGRETRGPPPRPCAHVSPPLRAPPHA